MIIHIDGIPENIQMAARLVAGAIRRIKEKKSRSAPSADGAV